MHANADQFAPSQEEIVLLRRMVAEHGENRVASAIGVSRPTLGRYLGGLRVYRGTALLFRRFLEACKAA